MTCLGPIELQKSLKNVLILFQRVRFLAGACAALCASALLAACTTPGAIASSSSSAAESSTDAESAAFEETFRSFSACDAGFFKSLHEYAKTWSEVASLGAQDGVSWIVVKNRNTKDGQETSFSKPPTIAGVRFLSYFDENLDLGNSGLYYFWGFMVDGNADDVARKISPLVHDTRRFHKNKEGDFVRTDIKVGYLPWLGSRASSGSAPGLFKVERVFMIEPESKQKGITRVSCSLQGGVTNVILKMGRPDIDPKDYPEQLSATLFDDTAIPASVIESLDAARMSNSLWIPKFKKLSYTYITEASSPDKKALDTTVEVQAQPNGLLRMLENYHVFTVQRLMFGGLVNLKSRMNGQSDGRVYVVNKLKLALPAELKPGAIFTSEAEMEKRPPIAGKATNRVTWKCEVKERLDANTIFPALTGKAAKMECQSSLSENDIYTKVYLEDLGVFVDLGNPSADGSFPEVITQMKIER